MVLKKKKKKKDQIRKLAAGTKLSARLHTRLEYAFTPIASVYELQTPLYSQSLLFSDPFSPFFLLYWKHNQVSTSKYMTLTSRKAVTIHLHRGSRTYTTRSDSSPS